MLLVLAGEATFFLPFVLPRIFRPTILEVFGLDNTQLGFCFSIYGIVALLSYLFGGILADKYEPRIMIAAALFFTGIGGFYFALYPSYTNLKILYAYWGFTTIFLLWSAMIKATRLWGGPTNQGIAFGFLDGGRGAVSATIGVLGVVIFSAVMGTLTTNNVANKQEAFSNVIYASTAIVLTIAAFVFFFLKQDTSALPSKEKLTSNFSTKNLAAISKYPFVWLLAVIILSAYCGYKVTDIFSQTANEVFLFNKVNSSKVATVSFYLRPATGLLIGFMADRTKASSVLTFSFAAVMIGACLFSFGVMKGSLVLLFFLSVLITSIGVYAARVLYFAVIQEGNIPLALTGTTVGVVSLVGYTPDIFMGPIMGYFLDSNPGPLGHQHVYMFLAGISFVGLVASILLTKVIKNQKEPQIKIH